MDPNAFAIAALAAILIYGAHGAYVGTKHGVTKIVHVFHHPKKAVQKVIAHEEGK